MNVFSEAASDGTPLYVENRFDARFDATYRCGDVSEILQETIRWIAKSFLGAGLGNGVANKVGMIAKVCA